MFALAPLEVLSFELLEQAAPNTAAAMSSARVNCCDFIRNQPFQ
jgi:hypothetical protein